MVVDAVRRVVADGFRRDLMLIGLLLAAALLTILFDASEGIAEFPWDVACVLAIAVTAAAVGSVALRRRRPGLAAAMVLASMTVWDFIGSESSLTWILTVVWAVNLYAVGSRSSVVTIALVAAGAPAPILATVVVEQTSFLWWQVLVVVMPVGVGGVARGFRHRARARGLRAQRLAAEEERHAVERERARIARELHDVVAHHVSGMVVSAGAALRVLDRDLEQASDTLAQVAESARRTSAAMHRMVGVLAEADGSPAEVLTVGQPGLTDLDDLLEHFGRLGCVVEMQVEGDLATVPSDAGLSAFRIVQESLTNALKHSGSRAATVRVVRTVTGLDVGVDDSGPVSGVVLPSMQGSCNGLIGMSERVALYGGTLRHGPVAGGGWSVNAFIPLA